MKVNSFEGLDAFQLEHYGPKTVSAGIQGDSLFFKPRQVKTKTKQTDIAVYGQPSSVAESLGHGHVFDNEFLTVLNHFAFSKGRLGGYGAFFKNFRRMKTPHNSDFDFVYLDHKDPQSRFSV